MGGLLSRVYDSLWGLPDMRVLMVGLDNAGKTTILYGLKLGEVRQSTPTVGFNVETVTYNKFNLTVWDAGGQDRLRAMWRYYYEGSDGVIFVVDASDVDRVAAAKTELHAMLHDELLAKAPFLVIANKQDQPNALSGPELQEHLGLSARSFASRTMRVQEAVAVRMWQGGMKASNGPVDDLADTQSSNGAVEGAQHVTSNRDGIGASAPTNFLDDASLRDDRGVWDGLDWLTKALLSRER